MSLWKKLLNLFSPHKKNNLFNVKIVTEPIINGLSFNLTLGFDIGVTEQDINVFVSQLILSSNGPKSRHFIENTDDKAMKEAIYIMCQAAANYLLQESNRFDFFRANFISAVSPHDKNDLN
jgi:hypothetical protein